MSGISLLHKGSYHLHSKSDAHFDDVLFMYNCLSVEKCLNTVQRGLLYKHLHTMHFVSSGTKAACSCYSNVFSYYQ